MNFTCTVHLKFRNKKLLVSTTGLALPTHQSTQRKKALMGLTISKIFSSLFSNREIRILMVGLDAAGKTTILYKLKLGEVVTTIPTIGMSSLPLPADWPILTPQDCSTPLHAWTCQSASTHPCFPHLLYYSAVV